MPMVVYTEEEVIDKCNEAEALGASRAAADRDRAMAENTALRTKLNDYRDAMKCLANDVDTNAEAAAFARMTIKRLD